MKIALTPLLLLIFLSAAAQQKSKTQPFILKGQCSDCKNKFIVMSFEDLFGNRYADTIPLDTNGKFYLKTWKIKAPVQAAITFAQNHTTGLNVAPGFDLTLTANESGMLTFLKTKKIAGTGAECNAYRFVADSIFCASIEKMRNSDMNSMSDSTMLTLLNEETRLYDSVAKAVFSKPIGDKNHDFFKQVTGYEVMFTKLSKLLFIIDWFSYNKEKAIKFLKDNFNYRINDIYRNEYMLSSYYTGFMSIDFSNYLVDLDCKIDSGLQNNEFYVLEKINKEFKGLIKEYALHWRLKNMIGACASPKELEAKRKTLRPFIAGLNNADLRRSLYNHLSEREIALSTIKPGMPAPAFTLESITGSTHSLADYKGKVVYVDVWASWCSPCRAEIPKLKALYEKYKNDDRIVFLSIAVSDKIEKWKKAVEDDKATWTQLFDKGNTIQQAYYANAIPKFILIDKQGNIVDPDAPRPSSGKEIEKLLKQEMEKQ